MRNLFLILISGTTAIFGMRNLFLITFQSQFSGAITFSSSFLLHNLMSSLIFLVGQVAKTQPDSIYCSLDSFSAVDFIPLAALMSLVKLCFFAVYVLAVFQTKRSQTSISGFVHYGNLLTCIHIFAVPVIGSSSRRMTVISMNSYAPLSYRQDHASFVNFAVLALEFIAMHPLFNMKSIVC